MALFGEREYENERRVAKVVSQLEQEMVSQGCGKKRSE